MNIMLNSRPIIITFGHQMTMKVLSLKRCYTQIIASLTITERTTSIITRVNWTMKHMATNLRWPMFGLLGVTVVISSLCSGSMHGSNIVLQMLVEDQSWMADRTACWNPTLLNNFQMLPCQYRNPVPFWFFKCIALNPATLYPFVTPQSKPLEPFSSTIVELRHLLTRQRWLSPLSQTRHRLCW